MKLNPQQLELEHYRRSLFVIDHYDKNVLMLQNDAQVILFANQVLYSHSHVFMYLSSQTFEKERSKKLLLWYLEDSFIQSVKDFIAKSGILVFILNKNLDQKEVLISRLEPILQSNTCMKVYEHQYINPEYSEFLVARKSTKSQYHSFLYTNPDTKQQNSYCSNFNDPTMGHGLRKLVRRLLKESHIHFVHKRESNE